MWGFLGSLVGAGGSLLGGIMSGNKQKKLQQQQWAREDNQLVRMVADAKNAKISPLAALGQNNYAQPTLSQPGDSGVASAAQQIGRGISGIKTAAQTELTSLNADLLRAQIANVNSETKGNTLDQMLAVSNAHTRASRNNSNQDGAQSSPLTLPLVGKVNTGATSKQQTVEDEYGGIAGEGYGLLRLAADLLGSGYTSGRDLLSRRNSPSAQKRANEIMKGRYQ